MTENKQPSSTQNIKRMAGVSLSTGCLTVLVAGVAIVIGFLIDRANGTTPRWMLIFLLGSLPLGIGGAYLIARRAIKRMRAEGEGQEVDEGLHEEDGVQEDQG
jgi:F0F1-type ATP synthase assembly protein I